MQVPPKLSWYRSLCSSPDPGSCCLRSMTTLLWTCRAAAPTGRCWCTAALAACSGTLTQPAGRAALTARPRQLQAASLKPSAPSCRGVVPRSQTHVPITPLWVDPRDLVPLQGYAADAAGRVRVTVSGLSTQRPHSSATATTADCMCWVSSKRAALNPLRQCNGCRHARVPSLTSECIAQLQQRAS